MKSIPATIAAHKKHIDPLKRRHAGRIKIASPAVTNGERDPNNQPMGLAYLDAFLKGCADCQIDYVAVHWYGPAHDTASFKKHIRDAHHMSGFRKVWVTEFGPQGSEDEQLRFLEEMLPWMDGEGYVFRYAMQWAGRGSLVNEQGSALTRVGHYYNTQ